MNTFIVRRHIVLIKEFEVEANTPEEAEELASSWDKKELLEYTDSWHGDTEVYDNDYNLVATIDW